MIKIVLNNEEFEISAFNRNTYISDGNVISRAYVTLANTANAVSDVHALAAATITSLLIKNEEETIYNAGTINAHISSIDESLVGTAINVGLNIEF